MNAEGRARPVDNVTLIGMPGSGKSSIGVVLAKVLGYDFLDADLLIQSRQGALLQELLDAHGLEAFLDMEQAAIRSISCHRTVIAPGGSCVLREDAMAHLKGLGPVVYLRLGLDELTGRITNLASRGIAFAPGQGLAEVYRQRVPLYERWADLTVDVSGQSQQATLEAVRAAINLK